MNGNPQGQVAVNGQEFVVGNWRTADLAVLTAARAAAERGEDLGAWLTRVVAIGAAAVNTAGTVTDVARIDSAMDRLDRQVRTSLDAALARLGDTVSKATDPETGDVTRAAQAAVDRLAIGVQRVLTGPDALLPEAAARAVGQVTNSALAEIHRLLDHDRQALARMVAQDRDRTAVELVAAVSTHQAELNGVVSELKELLAVRSVSEAGRASGPRKGLTYETELHLALADIAAAAGDGGADFTGATTGADGSRKGDVVVDLSSLQGVAPRLVVEAKNRPSKSVTTREWADALDAAMKARKAHVALGVCPLEQMPGRSPVVVLDHRRLLVAWDPDAGDHVLGAAYLLMRMAAGHARDGSTPLQSEIEGHLRTIAATMTALDEIQRQAGTCRRAADKIALAAAKAGQDLAERIEGHADTADSAAA